MKLIIKLDYKKDYGMHNKNLKLKIKIKKKKQNIQEASRNWLIQKEPHTKDLLLKYQNNFVPVSYHRILKIATEDQGSISVLWSEEPIPRNKQLLRYYQVWWDK